MNKIYKKTRVDRFRIEKIVDWKTINGKRYGLVKWMDYDDSYNSWEPAEELQIIDAINNANTINSCTINQMIKNYDIWLGTPFSQTVYIW